MFLSIASAQIVMKKIFLKTGIVLFMVPCVLSCKDDPGPSLATETVLSKVFVDGELEKEYLYNSDKQLDQIREYDGPTGQLKHYTKFEYDARGDLQNEISYNADGKVTGRNEYLKDSDGKFISSERVTLTGADSGKVITRHTYEYDEEGYISKQTWLDLDTQEEESYRAFFYHANGNLKSYEYYWSLIPTPEKAFEVRYRPEGRPLPESISKQRGYPINLSLYLLVAEQIEYETFDTALATTGEYHELISGRIYDNEGFVTEQTITYKYLLPVKPDEVVKMNYEYIKI